MAKQPDVPLQLARGRFDQLAGDPLAAPGGRDEQPGQPMAAWYLAQAQGSDDLIGPGYPKLALGSRAHGRTLVSVEFIQQGPLGGGQRAIA
ncbi:hypothetical protein D9M71_664980 [compost metagenome]